ncbi:tRNA-intron lyase [Candidatus Pacearchaeota archaeon CG10_big_fil_rev_8_21_14_0_10_35_219]|nr:tRNA-intron lyase [Candidatus Pacearchaeota archaeon]OIO41846.1 MAG: tRNA-intron lyase [Candidatus Pacearchaeota archaeon CG1_02_35_32]PIO08481.1 MAG: tRNA-intron lyase [Candidatus Pacearchaeota archaeon CG10_big_fil_rev_8_21_14_0_10_35_219]PIY81626.1 MAG: tRNA-intron lyase [Candidatus Pacearchaeota archaeon CG_4_10_14_0_8_um_filter_35_169]PIZ80100.1 MAG: tRNA-intron lyase [Candidatus Pacearchaeota archaeon CG_4_10_14_0_2_um_filter_35_33]PJA70337.1 MAG: tRNA-intron lyase [Candidatus Pacearc
MIQAKLSRDKLYSNSTFAFSLFEKSRFGEKKPNKIEYSGYEALFLLQQKKLKIFQNKKQLTEDQLLSRLKRKDKNFETKSLVFNYLRKKGYIVKTALKFGADFRVYQKGIKPGQDHALWLVHCVRESEKISWYEFSAKNRVAHSSRKTLLLAIVDDESGIIFYEIAWKKP